MIHHEFSVEHEYSTFFWKTFIGRGFGFRHVADIGMHDVKDSMIIDIAKKYDEVIITNDLDYGHLLAFSGETTPSVIIFRLKNNDIENLFARMFKAWDEIQKPLQNGAIVIIEEYTVRIRSLPIWNKPDESGH